MKIRKINSSDASQFLQMLLQLDQETTNMMYEPTERPREVEYVQAMIEQHQNSQSLILVAEDASNIVGFLTAERGCFLRIRHSAYIVTGILKQYQGLGLGSKFFDYLEEWAKNNNLSRLELTVMKHNESAIHLYQKKGFEIEGVKRRSLKVTEGYIDEYYMAKLL
ncbi:MAG: N-acetyltransferase [Herbinix sp.]|jgi:ribosomal protein S18 acetylase RimI-like enzyme|nr:N-acetyltransferase [Herbinix sp.]